MKLAVLQSNHSSFYPWAKSSLRVMPVALMMGVVSAIAAPGFLSPAIAQPVQQSRQALVDQPSGAARLGGVVGVNCLQVQYMPVKPKDCESIQLGLGNAPTLDRTLLLQAEKGVNAYTRLHSQWQPEETRPKIGVVISVPPLF
jgi:hypothetical protein